MANNELKTIQKLEETSNILESALKTNNKTLAVKKLNWRMKNEINTSNATRR